eukprot:COSAG02_NODE_2791_length_8022_cov_5.437208_3_plen_87_part_00
MPATKASSKKKQKQCDPNHPHCARILLIDSQQRLLLVKELKHKQWNLPGGLINPGEDACINRENQECRTVGWHLTGGLLFNTVLSH